MTSTKKRFTLVLLMAGAMAIVAFGSSRLALPQSPTEVRPGSSESNGAVARMRPRSPEERAKRNQEWAKRQVQLMGAAAGAERFGRSFRVPSPQFTRSVTPTVYVDPGSGIATVIIGPLEDPIAVTAERRLEPVDWEAWVAETTRLKKEGAYKADSTPSVLEIGGHQGIGQGPGYNAVGDEQYPRPGYVTWWDDGVEYEVLGRSGDSLESLLAIAQSMYE